MGNLLDREWSSWLAQLCGKPLAVVVHLNIDLPILTHKRFECKRLLSIKAAMPNHVDISNGGDVHSDQRDD
jgi:hypothetical protein